MSIGKYWKMVFGKITSLEKWTYVFMGIICVVAVILGFSDDVLFDNRFANEDGVVENFTALVLLGVTIVCGIRLVRYWKSRMWMWLFGTGLFAILFFFAAGEEISWGQRIFGWESNDYFMENNSQKETNIHNLVVGETKLNTLIFSQLLSLMTTIYLLILPILYRKIEWIQKTADNWGVPVARWHHTIALVLITLIILIVSANRKWEVYEMGFGLIFLLIFINPFNREAFRYNLE